MTHSFRFRLAFRFTLTLAVGLLGLSAVTYVATRATFDRQIDASLLAVASIQAASLTDVPSGEMHFHEWELTPDEAAQVRDLNRFAEVWSEDGRSLLRTRYITSDLPLDTVALEQAASGLVIWVEGSFQGIPVRSLYYPLGRLGKAHGQHVLQVAAPLEARNRLLRQAVLLMLALVVTVAAGTLAGSWWLAGRAVSPVHQITEQAEEIGAESLGRRIEAHADSREYQRLVQVLNTMLGRIDTAFEAQRRFTADASHELRSPLTALRGEIELARRRPRAVDEYERVLDSALEEVGRLTRVTEDLLTLARSDSGVLLARLRRTDLREVVGDVVGRSSRGASDGGVRLVVSGDGDASVWADADLVDRLFRNLIENAVKFTPAGGDVVVQVTGDTDDVCVRVMDCGPGIPEGSRARIFERFFRVDEARTRTSDARGTGLGLAIVRAIADLHGATLAVRNRSDGGAEFAVHFPRGAPSLST